MQLHRRRKPFHIGCPYLQNSHGKLPSNKLQ
jgi:hypothetical protein